MKRTLLSLLIFSGLALFTARPVLAQVTATFTPTFTNTNTRTFTPTNTLTGSPFPTSTFTPTFTNTPTHTNTTTPMTPTQTATNSPTKTPTNTPTNSPTNSTTWTPTAAGTATVACNPETIVNITGNLSSTQQANQPGGVLQLGSAALPVLPFMTSGAILNGSKAQVIAYNGGNAVQQVADLAQPPDAAPQAFPNHTQALEMSGTSIPGARAGGVTTYAWNQGGDLPPTLILTRGVTDSLGAPRQITFYFYQVNDLGTAAPPVNAPPPASQVCYAWYAFETTGAQTPSNSNLIGGTGVFEGDNVANGDASFNRCVIGDTYWGDFLYFNTDGSLASEGSVHSQGGIAAQGKAYLYLPIAGLSGQFVVEVNFGTAGMLGYGQRDGMTGDAGAVSPTITPSPVPTDTFTPTISPTPSSTPVTVTYVYVNDINTCAGAFGCSVSFATACRQMNLDFTTTYILMRLGATCGCQPSDIMTLRLTMSWDEICQHYGLDWTTFVTDLQARINTLAPEFDTPDMILRAAANDPTQFPINNPASMPDTLTYGSPVSEVCPSCP